MDTYTKIITATIPIMARDGYAGTSIRKIADTCDIEPSVIYYHFADKATLLRKVRAHIVAALDAERAALPVASSASEMLRQHILFDLKHAEALVCLLQHFIAAKDDFPAVSGGYIPRQAYMHIFEVVERGLEEGSYHSTNVTFDAKAIMHMIGGFLLEQYPHELAADEQSRLADAIATFAERALRKGAPE